MQEQDPVSWSLSSLLQEYAAGLLVLGLGLWLLFRNLGPGVSGSSIGSGGSGDADVAADELRKKRLEDLQRKYDEQALTAKLKQQEKESERLKQQEQQLRRMQGQGNEGSSSRLRAEDYNPLMGQSGSGYRPEKRKPPGGGCCGSGCG